MILDILAPYPLQQHYIGGRFVPASSGETFESINPATNELLATAAAGDEVDVDAAVRAARARSTMGRGRG